MACRKLLWSSAVQCILGVLDLTYRLTTPFSPPPPPIAGALNTRSASFLLLALFLGVDLSLTVTEDAILVAKSCPRSSIYLREEKDKRPWVFIPLVTCLVFGAALLALGFSVALCSLDRWPV
jgi:hypothetical protein